MGACDAMLTRAIRAPCTSLAKGSDGARASDAHEREVEHARHSVRSTLQEFIDASRPHVRQTQRADGHRHCGNRNHDADAEQQWSRYEAKELHVTNFRPIDEERAIHCLATVRATRAFKCISTT